MSESQTTIGSRQRKVVLLSCSVAVMNLPGLLIARRLLGGPYHTPFVILWTVMTLSVLVVALAEFAKWRRQGEA